MKSLRQIRGKMMPVDLNKIHYHMQNAKIYQDALRRADKMLDRKHYVLMADGTRKLMHRDDIAKELDNNLSAARQAGGEAGRFSAGGEGQ
jgi:hypothetical protein